MGTVSTHRVKEPQRWTCSVWLVWFGLVRGVRTKRSRSRSSGGVNPSPCRHRRSESSAASAFILFFNLFSARFPTYRLPSKPPREARGNEEGRGRRHLDSESLVEARARCERSADGGEDEEEEEEETAAERKKGGGSVCSWARVL